MRLLTAVCLLAYLLIDSGGALLRAREAIALWASSVAPSLFPFLALLPALTDEAALVIYEKLFGKCMKKLFRISGACAAPCLIGMIAGSPAGSVATLRAYRSGAVSRRDARVLTALSTGAGPVFIISSVGGGMMNDVSKGVKLFLCAWISSLITAFLVSRVCTEGENAFSGGGKSADAPGAIREAVLGVLTVAGYMTVFRVFAGGLPETVYAFFEISGGCAAAASENDFVLACAVTGFGGIFKKLTKHFGRVHILMDTYTLFAAKISKFKNPINDVGVTTVYGLDDPKILEENTDVKFIKEHEMTPDVLINELKGMEKSVFKRVFAGKFSKKLYRLYEFTGSSAYGR